MADESSNLDRLALLKANVGITSNARDEYLNGILSSVVSELADKGVRESSPVVDMLIVDYAAWRFRNRSEGAMPRNLQYRLHNLQVKAVTPDA